MTRRYSSSLISLSQTSSSVCLGPVKVFHDTLVRLRDHHREDHEEVDVVHEVPTGEVEDDFVELISGRPLPENGHDVEDGVHAQAQAGGGGATVITLTRSSVRRRRFEQSEVPRVDEGVDHGREVHEAHDHEPRVHLNPARGRDDGHPEEKIVPEKRKKNCMLLKTLF